jgi:hypothetical protein
MLKSNRGQQKKKKRVSAAFWLARRVTDFEGIY